MLIFRSLFTGFDYNRDRDYLFMDASRKRRVYESYETDARNRLSIYLIFILALHKARICLEPPLTCLAEYNVLTRACSLSYTSRIDEP